MKKDYNISILFDFYARVLTEKQREVIELYHNQDLSLAEITQHINVTRQGIRDSIKRGEATMIDLEKKIGYIEWFFKMNEGLDRARAELLELEEFNSDVIKSAEIKVRIKQISDILGEISD